MLRSRLVSFLVGLWMATALVLAVWALNAPKVLWVVLAPGAALFNRVVLPLAPRALTRQLSGDFGEFADLGLSVVSAVVFWAIPFGIAWWFLTGRSRKHDKVAA